MNLSKNRLAAFGAAGALAAGSVLAGGLLSPASAATGMYTCTLSSGPETLPIDGTMSLPAAPVAPGAAVTGVATTLGVTLPASVSDFLVGIGITSLSGSASNVSFPVGSSGTSFVAPLLATTSPVGVVAGTPTTLTGGGDAALASAPTTPGTYDVQMPQSFTFEPVSGAGLPLPPVPCDAVGTRAVLGQLTVEGKEPTTTKAKFLNTPLTTAKKPLIRVRVVQDDGGPAAGRVIVKEGREVLKRVTLNEAGKKKFRIAKLSRGKHKIVFRYKGNGDNEPSKVVKIVRVRRA